MIEAYYFAAHGKDLPLFTDDPNVRYLEEIAERLPARLVDRLESIFDQITDRRPLNENHQDHGH